MALNFGGDDETLRRILKDATEVNTILSRRNPPVVLSKNDIVKELEMRSEKTRVSEVVRLFSYRAENNFMNPTGRRSIGSSLPYFKNAWAISKQAIKNAIWKPSSSNPIDIPRPLNDTRTDLECGGPINTYKRRLVMQESFDCRDFHCDVCSPSSTFSSAVTIVNETSDEFTLDDWNWSDDHAVSNRVDQDDEKQEVIELRELANFRLTYRNEESEAVTSDSDSEERNARQNDQFHLKLEHLKDVIPDADTDFLKQILFEFGNDPLKLNAIITELFEKGGYPMLRDRDEREKMELIKKFYRTRVYDPEEVLQWFEDPVSHFNNTKREVTDSYRQHSYIQTHNDWPKLTCSVIRSALLRNRYHYVLTKKQLKKQDKMESSTIAYNYRKERKETEMPDIPDEVFYKELVYSRVKKEVKYYLKNKEMARAEKIAQAALDGSFLICLCCFNERLLFDESVDCGKGHCFCCQCVRAGAEVAAGQGLCELSCMTRDCTSMFSLPTLQDVLKPSIFSNWLIRLQTEEVTKANIPDLVQCPHCCFAAIMPNPDDKVFYCLNAECLKETCRLCKQPNHVPLRCDELQNSGDVSVRTSIEEKMTKALVRVCPACGRRFTKEIGCNMMKCFCGQKMCYICRQPVTDYSHFGKNKCPHFINTDHLHQKEVAEEELQAKRELIGQKPNFRRYLTQISEE